ncbi:PAS domain-containing protein [Fusarium keratoplasticum]|nr:PAS domain-containing protein [Fusarium keratoplasticum]
MSLDMTVNVMTFISGRKGSEWYGTDAHFALNRFLDYTETLCDSPPRSFPGSPSLLPVEASQDLDSLGGMQNSLPEVAQYPTTLPIPRNVIPPPLPKAYSNAEPKFDLLGLLWKVTGRKNPKFDIGTIDLSCSFVVCDITMDDCPIVYASAMFQNLTGYSRREVVGKNCRFLQAPDGFVQVGQQRNYVDNEAVLRLKKGLEARDEVQQSLINYRKGGKPFLNLLTLIPIPWDGGETRFYVGFQVDLVEQPGAIIQEKEHSIRVDYRVTGSISKRRVQEMADADSDFLATGASGAFGHI